MAPVVPLVLSHWLKSKWMRSASHLGRSKFPMYQVLLRALRRVLTVMRGILVQPQRSRGSEDKHVLRLSVAVSVYQQALKIIRRLEAIKV